MVVRWVGIGLTDFVCAAEGRNREFLIEHLPSRICGDIHMSQFMHRDRMKA